jgi:hypothetical protein
VSVEFRSAALTPVAIGRLDDEIVVRISGPREDYRWLNLSGPVKEILTVWAVALVMLGVLALLSLSSQRSTGEHEWLNAPPRHLDLEEMTDRDDQDPAPPCRNCRPMGREDDTRAHWAGGPSTSRCTGSDCPASPRPVLIGR